MKCRRYKAIIYWSIAMLAFIYIAVLPETSSTSSSQEIQQRRRPNHRGIYKKGYMFSADWFSPHIPHWSRILADYKNKPDVHYLEVGVYEGRALIWMLENVLTHSTANATVIDIFPEDLEERFLKNLNLSGFADKVTVIKGSSQIELKNLAPNTFDIIYIDGDHSAPAVLTDAVLSWLLLKEGGILIFDDYKYKLKERPPERRPLISIDTFVGCFKEYVDSIYADKQYIIRKQERIYWEEF
jgi:predicted O-methyltransferase YrrM